MLEPNIPDLCRFDATYSEEQPLVYLHGLLPAKADDTALSRFVVISGDFGLTYLTERWAARSVSSGSIDKGIGEIYLKSGFPPGKEEKWALKPDFG